MGKRTVTQLQANASGRFRGAVILLTRRRTGLQSQRRNKRTTQYEEVEIRVKDGKLLLLLLSWQQCHCKTFATSNELQLLHALTNRDCCFTRRPLNVKLESHFERKNGIQHLRPPCRYLGNNNHIFFFPNICTIWF